MKKKTFQILLFIAFSLFASVLYAKPFLVSAPYPKEQVQPTDFTIVADKLNLSVPAEKLPDGTARLKVDVGQFPDGEYLLWIKAVNKQKRIESQAVSVKLVKKNEKDISLEAPPKELIPPSRTMGNLIEHKGSN